MEILLTLGSAILRVQHAHAQDCPSGARNCVAVDIGYDGGLPELVIRIVTFLTYFIGTICTIMLIVGGLVILLSRGQDSGTLSVSRGKSLIIDSLIGLGVVLGAQGILRIVMYILYAAG